MTLLTTKMPRLNPDSSAHTRPGDLPGVKITREIPLPWLIGTLFAILASAASGYFTQQRQGELISTLVAEVKDLKGAMQTKEMKDFERDMKYNSLLKDLGELKLKVEHNSLVIQTVPAAIAPRK